MIRFLNSSQSIGIGKGARNAGMTLAIVLAEMFFIPALAGAQWVYFSEEEVLKVAFADDEDVVQIALETTIDPDDRIAAERKLGYAFVLPYMKCFQGSRNGQVTGYACIDNVIGRYRPITFMIKFNLPGDEIAWYEVMVYREAIGRGVRRGPFREQFLGKSFQNTMKYGKDLRIMTGATMSSNGLRRAFRKHQFLYTYILKNLPLLREVDQGSIPEMQELQPVR